VAELVQTVTTSSATRDLMHIRQNKLRNSADKLRMPRICCLFSCWISSRSRHAELVCTITQVTNNSNKH